MTFLRNDTTLEDFVYPGSPAAGEALLASTNVPGISAGVALARRAIAAGETPVVLADHSGRSGYATWLLREIIAQGLSMTAGLLGRS